jgi:hypothetical protein
MNEQAQRVLSLLDPQQVEELGGLPPEGIVGVFASEALDPQQFRPNQVFIEFMHQCIATYGILDLSLQAAARNQDDGWIYVIDLRTPEGPTGRVPPEDIVGGFEVKGGRLVEGSYSANPGHLVYSRNGIVQLPQPFQRALLTELRKVQAKRRDSTA